MNRSRLLVVLVATVVGVLALQRPAGADSIGPAPVEIATTTTTVVAFEPEPADRPADIDRAEPTDEPPATAPEPADPPEGSVPAPTTEPAPSTTNPGSEVVAVPATATAPDPPDEASGGGVRWPWVAAGVAAVGLLVGVGGFVTMDD